MRKISRTESSVAEGWAEEEECSAEEEEGEEVFAEEVEFSVAVVTVEALSWWWWWFFSGELLLLELEFAEVEAAAFTPKRLRTMRIISSRICSAISLLLLLMPCLLFVLKGLVWLEEFPPNKEDEEEEEVPW